MLAALVLAAGLGPGPVAPQTYVEAHWLRLDAVVQRVALDARAAWLPTCLATRANGPEGRPETWLLLRAEVRRPSRLAWHYLATVRDGEDIEALGPARYVATCYLPPNVPGLQPHDSAEWAERVIAFHVYEVDGCEEER